jgi:hypothetical protein
VRTQSHLSHGVPNFPDPITSASSISFPVLSGAPSAADEARMLAISECMRAHGVSSFPDPTTTAPSNPTGYSAALKRAGIACHFGGPVGQPAGNAG